MRDNTVQLLLLSFAASMSTKRSLTNEEIQNTLETIPESESEGEDEYVPHVATSSSDLDPDSIKDTEDLEIDEHVSTASTFLVNNFPQYSIQIIIL